MTQYTDGLRLTNSNTLSSGSLDDLKDTQFRLIDLNVTGKPYGVTSRGFLRVSKFDGNATLQEFFVLTEGSEQHASKPYVRMSNGNIWSEWYATSVRSKIYSFDLTNTTFSKSGTGIYYAKQALSGFNQVLSVSLKDCTQLPNALFMPYLETSPSPAVGLYVADPSAPASITFPTGIVSVNVIGF